MKTYEFHPAADIFPLMEGREFKDLVDDVKQHGVIEPVHLVDGKIIDGRNRYRAATKAQRDCRFKAINLNGRDPVDYVWSLNQQRRHLPKWQQALFAVKSAYAKHGIHFRDGKPVKVDKRGRGTEISDTLVRLSALDVNVTDLAERHGVSPDLINYAQNIYTEGTPELICKVESAEMDLTTADKAVRKMTKQQQKKVIAKSVSVATKRTAKKGTNGDTLQRETKKAIKEVIKEELRPTPLESKSYPASETLSGAIDFMSKLIFGLHHDYDGEIYEEEAFDMETAWRSGKWDKDVKETRAIAARLNRVTEDLVFINRTVQDFVRKL